MPVWAIFALLAGAGVVLALAGAAGIRLAGGSLRTARRLAGATEMRVGSLLDASALPDRPVRLSGRVRCRDPLFLEGDERLVAYHRDVEVRLAGGAWRSVERVREARSFDLWDHDGSLTLDPSDACEPLLTIPSVWRGSPSELGEPHSSAIVQLEARHGTRAVEARATTRTLNVTDRLLVLAHATSRPGGGIGLQPPEGGYLITNLALPDAMRLLGGRHRRGAAASLIALISGLAIAVIGVMAAVAAAAVGWRV